MEIKNFKDEEANLLEERLPKAFNHAVRVSKEAELLIYMTIVKCLEEFSDVSLSINASNPVCHFFDSWARDGKLDGSLSYSDNGDMKVLSCKFDLFQIRDTFETLSSDLFGTIDFKYYDSVLSNSGCLCLEQGEVNYFEANIQKVKLPGEVKATENN